MLILNRLTTSEQDLTGICIKLRICERITDKSAAKVVMSLPAQQAQRVLCMLPLALGNE